MRFQLPAVPVLGSTAYPHVRHLVNIAGPHTAQATNSPASAVVIALIIVFLIGLGLGRRRGLKHLSEVEFRNRWLNIRNHKRF